MAEIQLTQAQQAAVDNRGGSLLVSAAAGSGKTKVLVERLFAYMERERCDVDDFLIITYTKAAAAELRGKIAAELSRRVAVHPESGHLRRQLFRVYQADIKTVDAFCAAVLRENVHLLPGDGQHALTPDFRVLDEQEAQLLRERVLERVVETFYARLEAGDAEGELLAETLGAGRDDRALTALVLEQHSKIQSHPYPLAWLEQVYAQWEQTPQALADCAYGRILMTDTCRKADFWARRLLQAAEEMADCPALEKGYAAGFRDAAAQLAHLRESAADGWDAMSAAVPKFPSLRPVRGEEERKVRAKAIWDRCKAEMKKTAAPYETAERDYLDDLREMAPAMRALIRLTADFTRAYQAEKLRRNAVDFSDQEHYAIEILTQPDGAPTELARQISSRYQEIMVDEYQDTNEVQNCIFRAVSRDGQNLFTVGDVKQSIYRFRLADPTIFLEKYLAYRDAAEAEDGQPRRVLLSQNFRSRREVLESTNYVFSGIMSREMGEMDYGEDEQLHFGASYYVPRTDTAAEFHLVSVEDTEDEQFDREEVEARFAARRIRQMLDEGYPVQDADGRLRPITPEDIVILMRSPRTRLRAFTDALRRERIPCSSGEQSAFFATTEIAVLFSFLQIIDNPRQDVPLISVMRSPLFGFTPDRLAQIRTLVPEGDYYDAVCADDAPDTAAFRATLDALRADARSLCAGELVWRLYDTCHVLGVFGAMEGGAARRANLIALGSLADNLGGQAGAFELVTQLRRLLENDRQPNVSTGQSGGGVQIMSIHRSKGLEFPVVILADLNKQINEQDLKRPVLVHPALGLGCERVDRARHIRYDSVSKSALALTLRREAKAEEMRILYVALTRAKEKLICIDCMKRAGARVRDLAAIGSYPAEPEAVASARALGDWLLLPLLQSVQAEPIRRWAGLDAEHLQDAVGWEVFLWENPTRQAAAPSAAPVPAQRAGEELPFDAAQLDWVYPHAASAVIPSKVTATQLKGRALDQEIAENAAPERRVRAVSFEKPRFLQKERGLTAAERGTAMHAVMQYLDFARPADEQSVREQVMQLRERRLLTPEQAAAIDVHEIAQFLRSPLAQRIRQAETLYREYRFALLVPATLYDPKVDEREQMMLQGVVDCCFDTPEGLVIVDFKTDRVRLGQEPERAEVYRPQLEAYSRALSRVLERNISERILYFFATGQEISL